MRTTKEICQDIRQIINDEVSGRDYIDLLTVQITLHDCNYGILKEMIGDDE